MIDPPPTGSAPAESVSATAVPDDGPPETPGGDARGYHVLARKYRPTNFGELVGQEALVRTLTNAIRTGRVAHAFMLTGVRGIGKTTTARIIARALNCVGPDGTGGPTAEPCGVCEHCRAIAADRHVDVVEMDAASNTKVEQMRDLLAGIPYRPALARYKIYIIDEVHMLSGASFNALLKTLEEPPDHVKFVFATTELRKVPVTVLSRCQRFDLRRLDAEGMATHLAAVAEKEGAGLAPEAIALLARAADGSVRDGLSLLDQVIAQSGGAPVDAETVRSMLGLADRSRILDLFDRVMAGDIGAALASADELYRAGADPLVIVQDLLDIAHWLTRLRLDADGDEAAGAAPDETKRAREMAAGLSVPLLGRAWQMLLKGVTEVQMAPRAMTALEMLLIRLAHVADLPTPGELVKVLAGGETGASGAGRSDAQAVPVQHMTGPSGATAGVAKGGVAKGGGARGSGAAQAGLAVLPDREIDEQQEPRPLAEGGGDPRPEPPPPEAWAPIGAPDADPADFAALAAMFRDRREGILHAHLVNDVHPVRFEPGRIEIRTRPEAPRDLASQIGRLLGEWTGRRWIVSISGDAGEPTLAEKAAAAKAALQDEVAQNPLVRAVLDGFPGARIVEIRDLEVDVRDGDAANPPGGSGDAPSGDFDAAQDPFADGNDNHDPEEDER